jgi:hypothetical protein
MRTFTLSAAELIALNGRADNSSKSNSRRAKAPRHAVTLKKLRIFNDKIIRLNNMKKKIRQLLAAATAFAAFCLAPTICQAQTAGGYSEISKTDKAVVAAANFAVETQSRKGAPLKLVSIERAKRQIVAGSNYRMCLVVRQANKRREAVAVIYRNLQNQFKLTSWTPGKCSAEASVANAPDRIVKNLYAAQKAGTGPFFQHDNRAAVDRFFIKDFADLIWKDTEVAKGEVGTIDFDPLYNAQDTRIRAFKIGQPEYGEGNAELADVPVTFKNMGKAETILFRLERDAGKTWKISDIYYPSNPESAASLKKILRQ